ncbi:hypothetical protein H5410_031433 [Solanum commersonii]|uniref:Uncharacterized protein n=1 Tax=Solanum commersonii TaxID=4109 RepID=A0A9J5YJX1_SOLCO|nr:hypothetical protein H5410_031433 [Solanum commersonii]
MATPVVGDRDHSIWNGIHVHDGLVYKRFSIGPVANVHYLRKLPSFREV